jgi:hypothetical protein
MTAENPFLWERDEYGRDIDIRKGYIQQTAKYISTNTGKPFEECVKFVLGKMKANPELFKDPRMLQLVKKRPGERVKDETTFLGYIEEIRTSGRIVSPSLVIYERPEVLKSVTAEWQEDNIAARKKSKRAMLDFQQIGEALKATLADYDQNARKIRINSVSGMRGFEGNPLFLATGHSSLTSLCRAAAGYGNATVERFLMGSRHYHTPEIAKANLMAMLTIEDSAKIAKIMDKYQLIYPSVNDVMEMVHRSSSLYWKVPAESAQILNTVKGFTPLERAVVCYSGDMFHLAKLNPLVIKKLFNDLMAVDTSDCPEVDTSEYLKNFGATEIAYVNCLSADIMRGTTHKKVVVEDQSGWAQIGKTAFKVRKGLNDWSDFISALFAPTHLPPTVANLKAIQRRACLAADTDSSIFTCEYWVEWFTGSLKRSPEADKVWYLTTYMACQCIAHSLAMLSANIGVSKSMLFDLAMKNEYSFPVFALTNLAKHYFASKSVQEGNVYPENKHEIKGVELRGSTATKKVLDATEEMMLYILNAAENGEKISAYDLMKVVAQFEIETIQSIKKGEYTYLRSAQIKPDSNKMPYYELWQDVFAPKYGDSIEPPIPCVKVTTELTNKTLMREWLMNMEDKALAERMAAWLDKYNRKDLKTIYLPREAIKGHGLPIEIQDAANVRKLAYQINSGFYRILESTGLYIVDRNNYRLVYDFLGMTA